MEGRTGQLACQQSPSYSAATGDDLPTALLNTQGSCHDDCTSQLAGDQQHAWLPTHVYMSPER